MNKISKQNKNWVAFFCFFIVAYNMIMLPVIFYFSDYPTIADNLRAFINIMTYNFNNFFFLLNALFNGIFLTLIGLILLFKKGTYYHRASILMVITLIFLDIFQIFIFPMGSKMIIGASVFNLVSFPFHAFLFIYLFKARK